MGRWHIPPAQQGVCRRSGPVLERWAHNLLWYDESSVFTIEGFEVVQDTDRSKLSVTECRPVTSRRLCMAAWSDA